MHIYYIKILRKMNKMYLLDPLTSGTTGLVNRRRNTVQNYASQRENSSIKFEATIYPMAHTQRTTQNNRFPNSKEQIVQSNHANIQIWFVKLKNDSCQSDILYNSNWFYWLNELDGCVIQMEFLYTNYIRLMLDPVNEEKNLFLVST